MPHPLWWCPAPPLHFCTVFMCLISHLHGPAQRPTGFPTAARQWWRRGRRRVWGQGSKGTCHGHPAALGEKCKHRGFGSQAGLGDGSMCVNNLLVVALKQTCHAKGSCASPLRLLRLGVAGWRMRHGSGPRSNGTARGCGGGRGGAWGKAMGEGGQRQHNSFHHTRTGGVWAALARRL